MKKFNQFLNEAKDDGEYGQQGGMAKSQLRMIMSAAKRLHDSLKDDDVLPGHIIANIVLASDYVTGSADYMESEMNDEEYDDDEMDDMDEEVEGSMKRNRELYATGRISKDEFDRRMGYGKYKKGQPRGVGQLGKSLYKNLTKSVVEEVELDEISTEKLRDYASKALQDKNKAKSDKRWKYGSKATDIVGDRDTKAAHDLKFNKTEEVKLDEEQKPAYHYFATKNGIGAKEMKLTHSKSKPFESETAAFNHIIKTGGRQDGIIHKVNSATGKVLQHRGIDGGQKGYPTPASDIAGDAPKHVRDLKEEVELDEISDEMKKKYIKAVADKGGIFRKPRPASLAGIDKKKEGALVKALKGSSMQQYADLHKKSEKRAEIGTKAINSLKKEEVELDEASDLRITKVYNKFPKKATYAVHSSDRKYYKEFDNEAAAKAHHAEKSGK